MDDFYRSSVLGCVSSLPSYHEDQAFYDYDRMNYIRVISEFDPIMLTSARKPSLDEQEGSISYEN